MVFGWNQVVNAKFYWYIIWQLLRQHFHHSLDVEAAVGCVGGGTGKVAEKSFGEFAHIGANVETGLRGGINNLFVRFVRAESEKFRAFAEIGVFGF